MGSNAPSHWKVVVNGEDQYALLPATVPVPGGWSLTGFTGMEDECINHVDEISVKAASGMRPSRILD